MFKFVAFFACLAVAAAAPGLIAETHSIVQPAILTKTAYVDTSASSAITHQSNVNLVRKVPLAYSAPVVHSVVPAAPVVHSVIPAAPLVKTVIPAAPLIKTVVAAPAPLVVPAAPLVKTVVAAPAPLVLPAAPLVKTVIPAAHVVSAPVVYSAYHK
ncbi:uncharacterized protein Dana_GF24182 [Drosophila ananassae]|uniref:Uncharacterized protein n=1 Tax=Drosophila ananassae TaxID=7217 RepID=B3M8L7_DROAN|nr:protein app1 [Drosophila ananassae]EDV39991.1 uncharacterized protein Dana_GF24182 [Drosophila ananassae]